MSEIDADLNLASLDHWIDAKAKKRLPFATALSLTRTAQDAQAQVRGELGDRFTIRRPYVARGIRIKAAYKARSDPPSQGRREHDMCEESRIAGLLGKVIARGYCEARRAVQGGAVVIAAKAPCGALVKFAIGDAVPKACAQGCPVQGSVSAGRMMRRSRSWCGFSTGSGRSIRSNRRAGLERK